MHDSLRVWFDTAADARLLRAWRRADALPAGTGAMPVPDAAQWRALLDRLALWLGAALCAAGLVCVVAANWEHLGKAARLYGLQAVLVATTLGALWLGLQRAGGRALLWLSMLVLGGLLTLIGQTYQTGADTWELFALWTALALPWAVAARHAAHWLTWAVLLNTAAWLWLGLQSWWWWPNEHLLLQLGLLNLLLLALWETAGRRWPEFGGRVGRWLLAAAAMVPLTLYAMGEVLDSDGVPLTALLAWALATLALGAYCWRMRRDLPVLALLALGIIGVVAAMLGEWLLAGVDEAPSLLVIALAVLGMAAGAGLVLRRLAREEAA